MDLITFRLLLSIARIDGDPYSVDLGAISPAGSPAAAPACISSSTT